MTSVKTFAWLTLLLPLAGTLVNAFGFRVLKGRTPGYVGTAFLGASFVTAVLTLRALLDLGHEERQVVAVAWDLARVQGGGGQMLDAQLSLLVDPLSVFMTVTITGVSTLIHLYSISYLSGDRGYSRYFAYLNFFGLSMLLLVLAGNLLVLIVGGAFVGAASYLLIPFW